MKKSEILEELNQLTRTITTLRTAYDSFDDATCGQAVKIYEEYSHQKERKLHLMNMLKAKSSRAKRIKDQAHLSKRFAKRNFDTFNPTGNEQAYKTCLEYARQFEDNEGEGIILMGGFGTGKTHLAASIANYVLEVHEVPVRFITSVDLLTALRDFKSDNSKKTLYEAENIDLLIIDDLGKEKVTDFTQQELFKIINSRYENELPTVITTNETPQGLEAAIGGASFSRLAGTCSAVAVVGSDKRLKPIETSSRPSVIPKPIELEDKSEGEPVPMPEETRLAFEKLKDKWDAS